MNSPQMISERLRQAMIDAGFVHPDGRPNVYALAAALADRDGGKKRDSWERQLRAWLGEKPGGMSTENAEEVADALGKPRDYLKLDTAIEELTQAHAGERASIDGLERKVDTLAKQFQAQQGQIGDLVSSVETLRRLVLGLEGVD